MKERNREKDIERRQISALLYSSEGGDYQERITITERNCREATDIRPIATTFLGEVSMRLVCAKMFAAVALITFIGAV